MSINTNNINEEINKKTQDNEIEISAIVVEPASVVKTLTPPKITIKKVLTPKKLVSKPKTTSLASLTAAKTVTCKKPKAPVVKKDPVANQQIESKEFSGEIVDSKENSAICCDCENKKSSDKAILNFYQIFEKQKELNETIFAKHNVS
jgi:hypothetical protein